VPLWGSAGVILPNMDPITIVLVVLLVGAAGVAGWLFLERGRLLAVAAEARGLAAAAEGEAQRVKGERDAERERMAGEALGLRQRIEESMGQITSLEVEATRLSEQVRSQGEMNEMELAKHRELFRERLAALEENKAALEGQVRERMAELNRKFEDTFKALATDALKSSQQDFFKLAQKTFEVEREKAQAEMDKRRVAVDELVKPIAETLRKTDEKLAEMERARTGAYAGLVEQVKGIAEANQLLRSETGRLVKALSKPEVRGRYGEIQLKRVAELAGMVAYCDFAEQHSQRNDAGQLLRPDMVVKLPNDRVIAVDAKTNTYAYLEAAEAGTPADVEACLERFAGHVADQAVALGKKKYWAEFEGSPEFVVMFMPGDEFLDAALARRPELLERAAEAGVIVASPSTLIGLLRAVAVGWREKKIEDQAKELFRLGRELHDRAATAFGYVDRLGKALDTAVGRYNDFVGSYQSRLEPTLKRFEEAGARSGKDLPEVAEVTVRARMVEKPEADEQRMLMERGGG